MKPILFNIEMVRAILDGRKTVTRRVLKPQPLAKLAYVCMGYKHGTWGYPSEDAWKYWNDDSFRLLGGLSAEDKNRRWTPPCHTGDTLYVRETWAAWSRTMGRIPSLYYKADRDTPDGIKWNPSIHMPREAARIFLRVTDVRVERLQDIDDDGVVAEGLEIGAPFDELWDSTIKPNHRSLYGWEANPWVFVISFGRISKDEALQ